MKSSYFLLILFLTIFIALVYFLSHKENKIINLEEEQIVKEVEIKTSNNQLDQKLKTFKKVLESKKSTYALYVKDLKHNKEYVYKVNTVMFGASIYKVPVAVGILHKIQTGKISLDTYLTYTSEAFEGGTGSIQNESFGTNFTINELLNLSLKESDNIANNILQRSLIDSELSEAFNLYEPSQEFYLNNMVSPFQMGKYLEAVINKDYLSDYNKEFLLNMLADTSFDNRISVGLDSKYRFSHKIGNEPGEGIWHDCGIVTKNNEPLYIACLMSKSSTLEEFQEVSKALGQVF